MATIDDPIQALQDDFDKLTRVLGVFRTSLTNVATRATESILPPGFMDVTQFRETLKIIDLEVGRVEGRVKDAMRESGVFKGGVTRRRF